jgi:hypothetical protein
MMLLAIVLSVRSVRRSLPLESALALLLAGAILFALLTLTRLG